MSSRSRLFILKLILIFFLSSAKYVHADSLFLRLSNPQSFDFTSILELNNERNSSELNVKAYLPILQEEKPFQCVKIKRMNPLPQKDNYDEWGNKIAEYNITLPPGSKKKIVIEYEVRLYNYMIDVDYQKIPLKHSYPQRVQKFLLRESHIESDHPMLVEEASRITALEPHPYYQALKIYDYIINDYTFELARTPNTALGALKSKVVQCCDATLLFIALCRARGIPAQYIGGLFLGLEENEEKYDCTHAWAQIYLHPYGWIHIDPTQGRQSPERRYLCFAQRMPLYFSIWKGMRDPYKILTYSKEDKEPAFAHKIHFRVKKNQGPGFHERSKPVFKNFSYFDDLFFDKPANEKKNGVSHWAEHNQLSTKNKFNKESPQASLLEHQKAVERSPESHINHQRYIEGSLKSDRIDDAITFYKSKLGKKDNNSIYHYYLGVCYAHKSIYSKALEEFSIAERQRFPEAQYLHNSIGYVYLKTKQFTMAIEELKKAIKIDAYYFGPYGNITDIFSYLEDWEDIIKWSEKTLKFFPDKDGWWFCLGYSYLKMKRYDKAIKALNEAIRLNPKAGKYHAVLGWTYKEKGDNLKARREITEGLRLGLKSKDFFEKMLKELTRIIHE